MANERYLAERTRRRELEARVQELAQHQADASGRPLQDCLKEIAGMIAAERSWTIESGPQGPVFMVRAQG